MSAYVGSELEIFENAKIWKNYFSRELAPFLRGTVLEVGAGIGANTAILQNFSTSTERWICLEPDAALVDQLKTRIASCKIPTETFCGTLSGLPEDQRFDSILYIDVLEHIENDSEEILRAAKYLNPQGHLIVLVPAHSFLFTPFDRAIGHFRRYSRKTLKKTLNPALKLKRLDYLDSVGLTASLANRLFLKQSMPTKKQIQFWDSVLVPFSKVFDRFFAHRLGKSLLLIASKL